MLAEGGDKELLLLMEAGEVLLATGGGGGELVQRLVCSGLKGSDLTIVLPAVRRVSGFALDDVVRFLDAVPPEVGSGTGTAVDSCTGVGWALVCT